MRRPACIRSLTLTRLAALAAVGLLASPAARAGARLDVDYVDATDFVEKSEIRIFTDLLDDDYNVIAGLDGDKLEVLIDGNVVPGKFVVESAGDAREWVAVAILMAAHRSYASWTAEDSEIGEAEPDVFKMEQQGFANLAKKLGGNDRIAVWTYDEKGLRLVDDWSEDFSRAAERIETKSRPPAELGDKANIIAPRFYRRVKEIIDEKIGNAENLPRRKVLVLMSDGKDARPKRITNEVDAIVESARTFGVKVYAVGFSLDVQENLVHLNSLASKTRGIYREISPERMEDIPTVLENIGAELKKQYVITFYPNEDWDGAEKPVKLALKADAPGGQVVEDEYDVPVRVGVKPTNWLAILKWVGIVLGGLLGIFLLIKLIGAIIRARRAAGQQVVVEPEYQGPYKGKLTVLEGPYAGSEFFLTEDVTTIGSIPGNGIVIPGPGVSKRHAGIKIEEMRFELADFGSTNGTYVNGTKITKQFLRDGDEIRLGETLMRFALK